MTATTILIGHRPQHSLTTYAVMLFMATSMLSRMTTVNADDAIREQVMLANFSTTSELDWTSLNDPVMGGRSSSSFEIVDEVGIFNGTNEIVPQLDAPGFAYIGTVGAMGPNMPGGLSLYLFNNEVKFPDVSKFLKNGVFMLNVSSSTPEYQGFKIAFLAQDVPASNPFTTGSFKSGFVVNGTNQWQIVNIPFNQFSWDWSSFTGNCDTKDPEFFGIEGTQHKCCESFESTPDLCPTEECLRKITGLEVWAEGVEGKFAIKLGWFGVGLLDDDENNSNSTNSTNSTNSE